jgi:putative IMPACT (imprinted ancient) family translation regulator
MNSKKKVKKSMILSKTKKLETKNEHLQAITKCNLFSKILEN